MIPQLLLGVIKSLVIDTATNLAKTHVEEVVKKKPIRRSAEST